MEEKLIRQMRRIYLVTLFAVIAVAAGVLAVAVMLAIGVINLQDNDVPPFQRIHVLFRIILLGWSALMILLMVWFRKRILTNRYHPAMIFRPDSPLARWVIELRVYNLYVVTYTAFIPSLGFVLAYFTRKNYDYYLPSIMCFILLVLNFPNYKKWLQWFENIHKSLPTEERIKAIEPH